MRKPPSLVWRACAPTLAARAQHQKRRCMTDLDPVWSLHDGPNLVACALSRHDASRLEVRFANDSFFSRRVAGSCARVKYRHGQGTALLARGLRASPGHAAHRLAGALAVEGTKALAGAAPWRLEQRRVEAAFYAAIFFETFGRMGRARPSARLTGSEQVLQTAARSI